MKAELAGKAKIAARWRRLLPAALPLLLAGCLVVPVPHTRIHTAAREGRVVDAVTGDPVAGARVVSLAEGGQTCRTDTEGRFRLPPVKRWHGAYLFGALSYSLLPFFDMDGQEAQPVRIEDTGHLPYDEGNAETATVAYRAFGGQGQGRRQCPVERETVAFPRNGKAVDGFGRFARSGQRGHEVQLVRLPGAEDRPEIALRTDRALRLLPEGTAREEETPFSLCFTLEDERAGPLPEGMAPPMARVLWFGRDAPVLVRFGCPVPLRRLGVELDDMWMELSPFWISGIGEGRVEILLANGLPARFAVHHGLPPDKATDMTGWEAKAWFEIGSGKTYRVKGWEVFGREGRGAELWNLLRDEDRRLVVTDIPR